MSLALLFRWGLAAAVAVQPTAEGLGATPVEPQLRAYDDASVEVIAPPEPEPVPEPAPAPEPEPVPDVVVDDLDDLDEDDANIPAYNPLVDSPEALRARHWLRSGAVFLVVGAVLTGAAIAMSQVAVNDPELGTMPCDPRTDPGGNGCTRGGRHRSTIALGVPGGALLAGGVAMVVVGKLQQKRLAAQVRADRQGFFLGVSLRF